MLKVHSIHASTSYFSAHAPFRHHGSDLGKGDLIQVIPAGACLSQQRPLAQSVLGHTLGMQRGAALEPNYDALLHIAPVHGAQHRTAARGHDKFSVRGQLLQNLGRNV